MKKVLTYLLLLCLMTGVLTACSANRKNVLSSDETAMSSAGTAWEEVPKQIQPKYVFLFIGDGMSYPQIQVAADYLGALHDEDYFLAQPSIKDNQGATLNGPEYLNFMNFPAAGTAVTFDFNSFAPDSASSATSISTGHKTYASTVNMDLSGVETFETIAEKVHTQLGMKVGIVSSANINHATPAAFYAHQPNRENYYEIGLELAVSGFEYFAGGSMRNTKGYDKEKPLADLYSIAEEAGYVVSFTDKEAASVNADSGKVILIDEHPADSGSLEYEIDRTDDIWSLADYVRKGVEVLDNDKGFFLMCEGGKIDWACHANDAASTIHDVIAFADAVQVAIDFAKDHANETLIIVTGDHETGGLTIGFANTGYDTYLTLLSNQKISHAKFDCEYVANYRERGTSFEEALVDIEKLFGLKTEGEKNDKQVLTTYEIEQLRIAFEKSINDIDTGIDPQLEYELYGEYDPLSVTLIRILNNKSGISFSSYSHTGLPVPVFADGLSADMFNGYYDNTEVFYKLARILQVQ